MIEHLSDLLRSMPSLAGAAPSRIDLSALGDALVEHWNPECRSPTPFQTRQLATLLKWLDEQYTHGAKLTFELPRQEIATRKRLCDRWLGRRLCWWPQGVPSGQWFAIVSSRLGRRLDQRPEWFEVFRAACGKIDGQQAVFLTAERTTTAKFAERAAELFGLTTLVVHVPRPRENIAQWLCKLRKRAFAEDSEKLSHAFLSPPINDEPAEREATREEFPLADCVTIGWADRLFVSHLRPRGSLQPLVRARLENSERRNPEVFLALGSRLVPPGIAKELLNLGAIGWVLLSQQKSCYTDRLTQPSSPSIDLPAREILGDAPSACRPTAASLKIISLEAFLATQDNEWCFLTHCTRGPGGRWPEQTEADFFNELIASSHPRERSSFMALFRIVQQQQIIASAAALRGGTPAVCFTAVSLSNLRLLRTYQPQRQCWNFEPYGICVKQQWLIEQGARAVIYGDDDDWTKLSATDRPFFQLAESRRGNRKQDWRHEQEWRHLGDVDLSQVDHGTAAVFVPTVEEATRLADVSRWPVIVLDS